MSTTEQARHDLIEVLRTVIGPEPTGTLMEYLPPTGWADVATTRDLASMERATKRDLALMSQATDARFEALTKDLASMQENIDLRFEAMDARFEARIHSSLRKQTVTLLTANAAMMSAFVAVIASL